MKIPKSLSEISVAQYQELYRLREDPTAALAYLAGVTREEMSKNPHKRVAQWAAELKALLETQVSEWHSKFKLDGVEFRMLQDWSSITTAEYIDLETYMRQPIENAHKIMGILYRPVVSLDQWGWYKLEEYEPDKYSEPMKRVPADIYGGAAVFFVRTETPIRRVFFNLWRRGCWKRSRRPLRVVPHPLRHRRPRPNQNRSDRKMAHTTYIHTTGVHARHQERREC